MGVTGPTPRQPVALVSQIRETVEFLRSPKVATPTIELDGVQIDLTTVGTDLGSAADRLDTVLTNLAQARKNAQTSRVAKNKAIERYDREFLWIARTLEGYFRLAGMDELAERIRPSARRAGRRAADAEPSGQAPSGEPAAGEPASEEPASETPPQVTAPAPASAPAPTSTEV